MSRQPTKCTLCNRKIAKGTVCALCEQREWLKVPDKACAQCGAAIPPDGEETLCPHCRRLNRLKKAHKAARAKNKAAQRCKVCQKALNPDKTCKNGCEPPKSRFCLKCGAKVSGRGKTGLCKPCCTRIMGKKGGAARRGKKKCPACFKYVPAKEIHCGCRRPTPVDKKELVHACKTLVQCLEALNSVAKQLKSITQGGV